MGQTIFFNNMPPIISHSAIGGKKEKEGNLSGSFDYLSDDQYFGQKTWEQAESHMQAMAINTVLNKTQLKNNDINFIFAGDLINQCVCSTYALRDFEIPFFGIYGACSTMAEGMILAAAMVNAQYGQRAIAVTSSHFSSAERQFRTPLSYGSQRTPTAQWTVTGAGAVLIDSAGGPEKAKIKAATVGKIIDYEITDTCNMGAAMAPAAADTILNFIKDASINIADIDHFITGDLGVYGSELLIELLKKDNIDITEKHLDCGKMIYDTENQDTHAGGSGCGCAASVFCGHILPKLESGELKNIVFCATGALMSPTLSQQGETIPGIAHLLQITGGGL